jgi:malonyl CoA-acyl carrier protein transacylase
MSTESQKTGAVAPFRRAVPATLNDWHRFIKQKRTINDLVEDIHRELLLDEDKSELYQSYLSAVFDEEAVEGSLAADNIEAARMIRERAHLDNSEIATKKLATIAKALGIVLRRYHESRQYRRNLVAGEVVSSSNNE